MNPRRNKVSKPAMIQFNRTKWNSPQCFACANAAAETNDTGITIITTIAMTVIIKLASHLFFLVTPAKVVKLYNNH